MDQKSIVGAMLLTEKTAGQHMSQNIYSIKEGTLINLKLIKEIKNSGYTRIPIVNEDGEVTSILHAKDLLSYNLQRKNYVEDISKIQIFNVNVEAKLDNILNHMIKNKYHIAIVKSFDTVVGVLTLEDIVEELLQQECIRIYH